jgi:SAM-dependent methyltransferase
MRLNDPATVAKQYEREDNLSARRALYEETEGDDPKDALWKTLVALAPERVLEVGGGPGELAERMRLELGATVSFVDVSPRMVELARGRGVDAQVGDVQELPFDDEAFDTAVAAWMLYHVPDLDRGLSELARVLQPGGALVAVTTSVRHLGELRALVAAPAGFYEPFSRENADEHLLRHFSEVLRYDADMKVTVRDRERLVAYQRSMSAPTQPVPDDVRLPFVTYARTSILVATK